MYLNVNLTPPPSSGTEGGSCTTPKTPEILNSLINLTSPPLPLSYSHYQCEMESGILQSPVSDLSSPGEECKAAVGSSGSGGSNSRSLTNLMCRRRDDALKHTAIGGGGGMIGGSPGTSGLCGPLTGSSPPSTPDLPSPVNTVEATKSALIKEGLKLQIRSKLQAAGVDAHDSLLLNDTKIFKDVSNDLTEEDEERRRRRRERNKVAATKCRNKKKEKTHFLMTESENVEDVNLKLKTEIQRLTSEKMKLEKLLGDPNHRAHCCRHNTTHHTTTTTTTTTTTLRPPLLIVTPAESPSSSSSSSTSSSSSLESPTSPPLPCSSYDPQTTMTPHGTSPTHKTLPMSALPPLIPSISPPSSSQYLTPKYNPSHSNVNQQQRHHPYQYPGRATPHHTTPGMRPDKQGYQTPSSPPPCQSKPDYDYQCHGVPPPNHQTHEFTLPPLPSMKSVYPSVPPAAPAPQSKSRSVGSGGGLVRYSPYSSTRSHHHAHSQLHHHLNDVTTTQPPLTNAVAGGCGGGVDSYVHHHPHPLPGNSNSGCGREDQPLFDMHSTTNQFFPPCSYSNM